MMFAICNMHGNHTKKNQVKALFLVFDKDLPLVNLDIELLIISLQMISALL